MKLRLVRDSTGSPSWTCTLAIPAAIVLTGRIIIGGFAIDFAHWKMAIAPADSTTVLALISFLGFFAQRDWRLGMQVTQTVTQEASQTASAVLQPPHT